MTTAVLSVGSNIGDRLAHLRSVVELLDDRVIVASQVYETAPWGGVDQAAFFNAVVIAHDEDFQTEDWLAFAQECESAAQRSRDVRWGPRTLDVDVIAVYDAEGMLISQEDPELTLPHPRAHERAFVLAPWVEVQPHAMLPQGAAEALLRGILETGDPSQAITRLDEVTL